MTVELKVRMQKKAERWILLFSLALLRAPFKPLD